MKTFQFASDSSITGLVIEEHPVVCRVQFDGVDGHNWAATASLIITEQVR
jgi:hypothetical protein